jgi:hypothetical protein
LLLRLVLLERQELHLLIPQPLTQLLVEQAAQRLSTHLFRLQVAQAVVSIMMMILLLRSLARVVLGLVEC